MNIALFSCRRYEEPFLQAANEQARHRLHLHPERLVARTAALASGCEAVSIFVGDDASAPVLERLHAGGTKLILLRSAGFNHVDLTEAGRLGLTVLRVPAYSPHSVAEHTVGLMLTLNRKFHRAFNRVREQNFEIDGLMGYDMHGRTVGVIGTGRIGEVVCRILRGFGCKVIAFDVQVNETCRAMGVDFVPLEVLYAQSDIVTIHCPLTPATHHLVNERALAGMRRGVTLINTSRGAIIDTRALITALKEGRIGSVGLDVYEEEGDLFFKDLSQAVIQDDVFVRLMTFPNVLITAHQGFFTREACTAIAEITLRNATDFERGTIAPDHRVTAALMAPAPSMTPS
ncbi:MAG: 2-hydroxyacid dehydrogenase [Phycisphaeraceae bacterium]|nr:2-hydroxyacid dehydrogenase [Phycisphaeraceae bacterium]